MSPIAAYLQELGGLLHCRRRRRIVAEIRAHLLDAAAAAREPDEDAQAAQRRAVARFGSPTEVASAFNRERRRNSLRALARRGAAVALAGAATASVGTATVWALEPGAAATARPVHARAAHVHHHGASRRTGGRR